MTKPRLFACKSWMYTGTVLLVFAGVILALYVQRMPKKLSEPALVPSRSYASLTELIAEQHQSGYLQVGRFGNAWPAAVVETIEGEGRVNFTLKNGTPHEYDKFDGYQLKVLRLANVKGDEVVLVLRSAEKIGAGGFAQPALPVDEDAWERERRRVLEERAAGEGR